MLLAVPRYTVGIFARDYFLSQLLAIAALMALWCWLLRYLSTPRLLWLVPTVLLGSTVLFSYPTLLPLFALAVAIGFFPPGYGPSVHRHAAATGSLLPLGESQGEGQGQGHSTAPNQTALWQHLLRPGHSMRRHALHLALVGVPLAALAALYLDERRREGGGQIFWHAGGSTAPSLDTLSPPFLALAAGLLCATLAPRLRPATIPVWLTLLLALAFRVAPGVNVYHSDKLVYLLAPQLAVLAAVALLAATPRLAYLLNRPRLPLNRRGTGHAGPDRCRRVRASDRSPSVSPIRLTTYLGSPRGMWSPEPAEAASAWPAYDAGTGRERVGARARADRRCLDARRVRHRPGPRRPCAADARADRAG